MAAIIVTKGNDGTRYYYGPFTDGDQATSWGAQNLKGFDWHWEDLILPGSTFETCSADDIVSFIDDAHADGRDCFITVDAVNWVVMKE